MYFPPPMSLSSRLLYEACLCSLYHYGDPFTDGETARDAGDHPLPWLLLIGHGEHHQPHHPADVSFVLIDFERMSSSANCPSDLKFSAMQRKPGGEQAEEDPESAWRKRRQLSMLCTP